MKRFVVPAVLLWPAVALAIGAPVGCWVLEECGPQTLWLFSAAVLSLAMGIYWLVYVRVKQTPLTATGTLT